MYVPRSYLSQPTGFPLTLPALAARPVNASLRHHPLPIVQPLYAVHMPLASCFDTLLPHFLTLYTLSPLPPLTTAPLSTLHPFSRNHPLALCNQHCPLFSSSSCAPPSILQGNVSVEKDVLYADRATFFPWRPRLWMAATDILLYSALAQALMLAWALLSPLTAGTQPVIWCKWGWRAELWAGGRAGPACHGGGWCNMRHVARGRLGRDTRTWMRPLSVAQPAHS